MARKQLNHTIPKEWKYDLLDTFTNRRSGHTPSQSHPEYWNGGIKWVSLADSSQLDNGFIYDTVKEISNLGLDNSSAELHPENTVIMARDAGIGKSAILFSEMAVSQHFIAWRCSPETISSWFLYNWLQFYKIEFERQAVGSTIKTIGLPFFKKLKIALPPIQEQQKIAEILSTWDKAITSTENLIANSEMQKKSLMQLLLTGKKRLLDENGVRFSGKWKKTTLGKISSMSSGGTPLSTVSEYYNGNIVWVSIADMTEQGKYVNDSIRKLTQLGIDNSSAKIFPKHTVLYAMYASIGECSIATKDVSTSQAILGIQPLDELCYQYLYFYLCSIKEKIKLQGQQGAQSNLNAAMVKSLSIALPSVKEQKAINTVLNNADREIELLQAKLEHLKQEKKALMQQLLTGKRRVVIN